MEDPYAEAGAIDREAVDVRRPSRSKQLLPFDRTADLRDQQSNGQRQLLSAIELANRGVPDGVYSRFRGMARVARRGSARDLWRWRDGVRRGINRLTRPIASANLSRRFAAR